MMSKPVMALDVAKNTIAEYPSISDACQQTMTTFPTFYWRLRKRKTKGKALYIYKEDYPSILAMDDDAYASLFKDGELTPHPFCPNKAKDKRRRARHELAYEVKNGVCVTPCPFRDAYEGRPFIGSASCMKCSSFFGKDKRSHTVWCTFYIAGRHG